jgi:omega-6 fatty acid desaturase (delta-12 desaturase)
LADAHQDLCLTSELDTKPAAAGTRPWAQILNRYREPNPGRSLFELAVTALPLLALWVAAWLASRFDLWWLSLLIAIPAGGFMVRLFIIQHDCGHGSFFAHKWANDWVGRVIGVVTMTPYDFWRRMHAMHHSTSGNLDKRGHGDIDTLTVREYLALPFLGRLKYRLYRNPLIMFGVGPAYMFLVRHRLPFGLMRAGWRPWMSTQATNACIALSIAALAWLVGVKALLLVHLPILIVAATAGVWLFYVQHQFEGTTWSTDEDWRFQDAAMLGSSYYDLPAVLRWLTGNIGIHHVHHANSRIPYYRLPGVLRDHPDLRAIGRVGLLQSMRCVRLKLWDEDQRRLVSFREARAKS